MQTSPLLEDIRKRLVPRVKPEDAIRAVMCTFSQHVSGGEARLVWASLPAEVQPLLDRCMVHRDEHAERFGRDQLLVRVANHLGIAIAEAEEVTTAVLTVISARLRAKEVADVAAQLPSELRELWVVPKAPSLTRHPVLTMIERTVRVPESVSAERAFDVVMCHFSRRLSKGEAKHLVQTLPPDLRQLLERCVADRDERAEAFGRDIFVLRVAHDLGMEGDIRGVEEVARAVFRYVEDYVPATVYRHVIRQVPRELADLWALPEVGP